MYRIEDFEITALVEEAQRAEPGDSRAFCELVRRHQGSVFANCLYLTKSPDDAEDLAQEVFVKAFFALRGFRRESNFKTWIHRIKINHCLNYLRKRRQEVIVDITSREAEMEPGLWVPPKAGAETDRAATVRRVLGSLPDTLRVPLILCDMDGLRYQEAADELGISLPALKMRIKRARELFRERFGMAERDERRPRRIRTAR